jgi:deazaflavin-dependent oxidoreductase (nitroreductase family)
MLEVEHQQEAGIMSTARPPSRLAAVGERILRSRPLMRAPIWIYKARAGAVLGSRFLMLEHIGRKSGARRYVVLEVVDHPTPDSYVVVSGFGAKAQWFRNIKANPRVRVYTGSRAPRPATARILAGQEADQALGAYINAHPQAWERFRPVLERTLGSPITETDTPLPIVELQLG